MKALLKRRRWLAVSGTVIALAIGGAAWAYFSSTGTGTGAGATGSLGSPAPVTGSPSGSTVAVSWSAVTNPGSGTFGYYVTRTPYPSGSPLAVCSSSPTSLLSGTTCNDTSVPSGNYTYTVTVVYNSWSNSATSPEVTVVATPPSASAPGVSATVHYGTNPYWVNHENVTLTDTPSTNGGSAIASVAYYYCQTSAAPCNSGNWLSIGSTSSGAPWSVTWSSGSLPTDGTYDVVAVATNSTSLTSPVSSATEVGIDTTGPSVSAPSVSAPILFGTNPYWVNSENVTLTDTASDVGSGVSSVAYYYCLSSVPTCTAGNGTSIGSSSTAVGNYSVTWHTPLPADGTYKVIAVGTDNVTNASTSAPTFVGVDTTPPTVSTPTVNGYS